jgi:hypothetical protein
LSEDPQCCCGALVLKSTVHETGSMTKRLGPMMFILMMLWATSFVSIMADNSGLPFRYRRTLQAPSVCIGCWLAFCTGHVIPGISPMTTLLHLIASKFDGVMRLTAAPVSYRAVMVGVCDVAFFQRYNLINGLREGLASSSCAAQIVYLFS